MGLKVIAGTAGTGGGSGNAAPVIVSAGALGATRTETVAANVEEWLIGTLTANHTLTVAMATGSRLRFFGKQDATGARTLTISDGTTSIPVTVAGAPNASFEIALFSPDGSSIFIDSSAGAPGSSVPQVDNLLVGTMAPEAATTAINPGVGNIRGGRMRMPVSGVLHDCWVYQTATVNGAHVKAAIYDTGLTTPAVRTKLWESGSTTLSAATNQWINLGDPGLAVTAGQVLNPALICDDATPGFACNAGYTQTLANLPAALTNGSVAPKLGWSYNQGSFSFFSTLADGAGPPSIGQAFLMLFRVV